MRGWRGDRAKHHGSVLGFALAAGLVMPAAAHAEHHPRHLEYRGEHRIEHHLEYHAARVHRHVEHYARRVAPEDIAPASAALGPTSPGPSEIVIDARSGRVLSEDGADTPRYPASLTKLMTLDLAFQALRDHRLTLDTQIPVSYHAASVEPVKLGLRPGSYISVHDAILAMTTMSANDAATALGEYLGGGSEARCAEMMTLRAHALGMAQTVFANASGLPNPNQVTTARDLALLARDLVENFPEDQGFFEAQDFDFHGRMIRNINEMLTLYPGATGMKTGYTDLARHNVITSADRDGQVLIGVVLHEPSWPTSYRMMTAMLDQGFGGRGFASAHDTALAAAEPPAPHATGRVERVASATPREAAPLPLAQRQHAAPDGSWTAQLGLYSEMRRARVEAIAVRQMRGVGIPRIGRIERHGHTLWTAQLAGLSQAAAHETCSALAAHGHRCFLIAPNSDHLADRGSPGGLGT